jgi:hypothetical protein
MYLIHAQLSGPQGLQLPVDLRDRIRARSLGSASIEHVTPHLDAPVGPVLGLFVAAGSLEEAERAAKTACLNILDSDPALAGYTLLRCAIALVTPFYEAGLQ